MNNQYKDFINLLSNLTFRKAFNILKIYFSYHLSNFLKIPFHLGMPYTVSIEPTTSCNLACSQCPSGMKSFSRPTGNLKSETFKMIINQLHKNLIYLILYFQGEPYLNKNFFDFVKYAKEKKIYTATSTNAHFLNDENAQKTINSGLDKIIISLDGTDQKTYEKYREKGDFKTVISGIENLVKWKKKLNSSTPFIIIQFIVFKHNEHQIEEIKLLGNKLSVDKVEIKSAQIYDIENNYEMIPLNEKYSRYKIGEDGIYKIKNKLRNKCLRMWRGCVITHDGLVVPCCFDKDAKYQFGDLNKENFNTIWKGTNYKLFRKKLLKSRKEIDICRNCTEGIS